MAHCRGEVFLAPTFSQLFRVRSTARDAIDPDAAARSIGAGNGSVNRRWETLTALLG
jgi:hypothetical protein